MVFQVGLPVSLNERLGLFRAGKPVSLAICVDAFARATTAQGVGDIADVLGLEGLFRAARDGLVGREPFGRVSKVVELSAISFAPSSSHHVPARRFAS